MKLIKLEKSCNKIEQKIGKNMFFLSMADNLPPKLSRLGPDLEIYYLKESLYQMLWSLPRRRIASKRVILNYQDLMQNRAPGIIFKQLGTPVFVETDGSQARAFTHFLGRNHLPFVFFCSLTNCWHFKIQNYCSAWYWVFSSNLCTWFGPKS